MLVSILAIVFVLRISKNSDRYAPKNNLVFNFSIRTLFEFKRKEIEHQKSLPKKIRT